MLVVWLTCARTASSFGLARGSLIKLVPDTPRPDDRFRSVGTEVTVVFVAGVLVSLGLIPRAARTSVSAVFGLERSYHETASLPVALTLRTAGRKCRPPASLLSTTGAVCTGASVRSA